MTKVKTITLMAIYFGLLSSVTAQFSRQQAIDKVLNEIVNDDIANSNVFAEYDSRSNQEPIVLSYNVQVTGPYTDNWAFFVDDLPLAN